MLIKNYKKLIFLSAVFICMLVFASGIGALPYAIATDPPSEPTDTLEKSLTIAEIIGLDTPKYNTKLDAYRQDLYFDILPQENIDYTFESDKSKIDMFYTYVNGNLRSLITYVDGQPQTTQSPTSTLELAKNFLNQYQTLSDAAYYTKMQQMLNDVSPDKDVTKTLEEVKLQVTYTKDTSEFRWTYAVNDIEAPMKCVALYFEQGFLKYFVDTWNIYTIGSDKIVLSETDAIEIAMTRAKDHSWSVSLGDEDSWMEVTEFNIAGIIETKLDFGNYVDSKEARGGDPFTLYPGWRVRLGLDDIYPGNVYGLDVGVWADTKEIHDIRTLSWLGAVSLEDNNGVNTESANQSNKDSTLPQLAWLAIPIAIGSVLVATMLVFKQKKNTTPLNVQRLSKRSVKLKGLLLLGLCCSFVFLPMAMPTASASRSIGLFGSTWNVTATEISLASGVVSNYDYYFKTYAGYDSFNAFGSYTTKSNVLSWVPTLEQSYDHVSIFHYGHGGYDTINGIKHWAYFDNRGATGNNADYIWDYEIYQETWRSKTWFVMLWACRQGDTPGQSYGSPYNTIVGMPYAWHHPLNNNYDCFIGFNDASIPLAQISQHHSYVSYNSWLIRFVYHGTYSHKTISQALNQASIDYFGISYAQTELNNGFNATWPGVGSGPGRMVIYGNSNLYFY